MRRYIDNCGGVVRIPVHERAEIQRYKKMVREYRQYYGKEPTERALCYLLEVSKEKLHSIQESARMGRIGSLSDPIGQEDDYALIDTIASDENIEEDCIERLDAAAMKEALWEAVDLLPGNQPEIIRKRYQERKTLKETGEIIGVSTERVRQIENKAMRTLRLPHRSKKFRGYYEEYLSACSYRHVGVDTFQRTWMSEVELEVLGW